MSDDLKELKTHIDSGVEATKKAHALCKCGHNRLGHGDLNGVAGRCYMRECKCRMFVEQEESSIDMARVQRAVGARLRARSVSKQMAENEERAKGLQSIAQQREVVR